MPVGFEPGQRFSSDSSPFAAARPTQAKLLDPLASGDSSIIDDDEAFGAWLDDHLVHAAPVTEDQVVGIGHVKREAGSLIARLRNPEVMEKAGASLPRGVLLFGPPGTGKTLTARFMASQIGADVPFYEFSSDELSPPIIRLLFRAIAARGQSVIYIDEIDGFGLHRANARHTENSTRTLTAMLTALDGLVQTAGTLVICSSNSAPSSLDPALMRSGRIGVVIEFKMPEESEREDLFRFFAQTRQADADIDWARAARMTRGKTPADIRQMLDDAMGLALMDARNAIAWRDVQAAINRDGVVEPPIKVSAEFWKRTALHEAGHIAATYALRGPDRAYSVVINDQGGLTTTDWDKNTIEHRTNVSILDQIVISLAGSRAENLFYRDFAVGSHSDHVKASGVANSLIKGGLSPDLGLLAPSEFKESDLISEGLRIRSVAIAERLIEEGSAVADTIVAINRAAIEQFAEMLVTEREMSGPRLDEAIEQCGFARLFEANPLLAELEAARSSGIGGLLSDMGSRAGWSRITLRISRALAQTD
jgi:cell division protease FtsH